MGKKADEAGSTMGTGVAAAGEVRAVEGIPTQKEITTREVLVLEEGTLAGRSEITGAVVAVAEECAAEGEGAGFERCLSMCQKREKC